MGSFINFKNFGDTPPPDGGGGGKLMGNFPMARQSSIYSLTFDELQSTLSGVGKDYGSMNIEDLLKNIWTAEESQALTGVAGAAGGNVPGGDLQRQGSMTLPRTVSQKTVDEVWRDFLKETTGAGDPVSGGANLGPRQATLGEMTLEEFLMKAGVVREDNIEGVKANNGGFYSGIAQPSSNDSGLSIGFQQPNQNMGLLGNQFLENGNSSNLVMNMAGVRSSQQPLFPKQTTMAFSGSQIASPGPGANVPILGMSNPSLSTTFVQNGATGFAGLRNPPSVSAGSPGNHDVIGKNNLDTSSSSTYTVSETGRGRRSGGTLEKVVERRRRRMIKNRESAARSRARKQAYTLELEAEVETLKEINQKLQKKHAELVEMQKNQIMEPVKKHPWGEKRRCLRRTMTGPW